MWDALKRPDKLVEQLQGFGFLLRLALGLLCHSADSNTKIVGKPLLGNLSSLSVK